MYSINKIKMELIEKLKVANGVLKIDTYSAGPDELGETESWIEEHVIFNGFINVIDYKKDLFETFIKTFNEVINIKEPKKDVLVRIHHLLNELEGVRLFLEVKHDTSGIRKFTHKYFKGKTESSVENTSPYMSISHVNDYLESAYEIYEIAISRFQGLLRSIEMTNENNLVMVEKPELPIQQIEKVKIDLTIEEFGTLIKFLEVDAILRDELGESLFTRLLSFFELRTHNGKVGSNWATLKNRTYNPKERGLEYWLKASERLQSFCLSYLDKPA
jgi:hypothetical protein